MRAGDSGLHDVCRQHIADASMGSTAYKTTRRIAILRRSPPWQSSRARSRSTQKQAWLTRMSCRGAPSLVESTVFTTGLRSPSRLDHGHGVQGFGEIVSTRQGKLPDTSKWVSKCISQRAGIDGNGISSGTKLFSPKKV